MRLIRTDEPGTGSQQAVWVGESDDDVQFLGVWTEKRPGLGEDAEPTLMLRRRTGAGLIGVYDGMGGAGARQIGQAADGRPISSAFAASRLAHLAVQKWFVAGRADGQRLDDSLREVLDAARPAGGRMLRGTIAKQLPTTIALINFAPGSTHGAVQATALWAGDSRCYLLTPDEGLQQLTRDDSAIDDPLETLMADQPLTNHLAAGRSFQINENPVEHGPGCVLLCATDGFFGYVVSPAMFEFHLLRTLCEAKTTQEWGQRLANWRRGTAGDDATLALAALGFDDFGDLRDRFKRRLSQLDHEHVVPLEQLENADVDDAERRRQLEKFRVESWTKYRDTYTRLMPGRAE